MSLLLAVTIMVQWFLWFVATSALYAIWGMGLGLVVVAAQICSLFLRKPSKGC